MLPIGLVLVVITMSLIVTRVATIALTLTGLSRESARFQARSALTGAGYTTAEAEKIVNHPIRRRIIMMLMLIGSAGIVSAMAGVMLGFLQESDAAHTALKIGMLVAGLVFVYWAASSNRVDRLMQRVIHRALKRWTDIDVRDYAAVLHIHGDYGVSELAVDEDDWLAGRSLAELELSKEGVLVLGVQRKSEYIGAPQGRTKVWPGDVLLLYGQSARFEDLDRRKAGYMGDRAHAEAAREQAAVQQQQQELEDDPTGAGVPPAGRDGVDGGGRA